jgi:SRSO17 transposase
MEAGTVEIGDQGDERLAVDVVRGVEAEIAAVGRRIGRRFVRRECRERAVGYMRALVAPLERKNGWQIAEALGEARPGNVQHLLRAAVWDADGVRDDLRRYVLTELADGTWVLVIDESGFVKKGTKSAGVHRQYCGAVGKVENCQIGVFLLVAGPRGAAFVDRALYLPEAWTTDAARCAEAGIPAEIGFATKPELARQMIERFVGATAARPWVTGDECYGADPGLRAWLAQANLPSVLTVRVTAPVALARTIEIVDVRTGQVMPEAIPLDTTAGAAVVTVPDAAWQRLSAGTGVQGERVADWTRLTLDEPAPDGWCTWLLIRRAGDQSVTHDYFRVVGPADASLQTIVQVAGTRWSIEQGLAETKGEVGLDQYEVRTWDGWHRHLTLALLMHAILVVVRADEAEKGAPISKPACKPNVSH